jgi:hypothetical protein
MNATTIKTEFAPSERVPLDIVYKQSESISTDTVIPNLLNSMINFVLILNKYRQIIFATENFLQFTIEKDLKKIIGLRPGEAFGCTHSMESKSGCGTTKFCAECGALRSILNSLAGYRDLQECKITRVISGRPEALDLLVYSSPFIHKGEKFVMVSFIDISHLKRRRTLEKLFFHDIMNSAGGLHSLLEQVKEEAPPVMQTDLEIALNAAYDILEQIKMQRELTMAENNELKINPYPIHIHDVFQIVISQLQCQSISRDRFIKIDEKSQNEIIFTDPTVLKRVIYNLIKNALEAIGMGKTVTIGAVDEKQTVRLFVHNPAFIPEKVQLQIFHRSFSTKGTGRGIGTYSVKLLTEGFLQGKVWFESTQENGTTFYIRLPKKIEIEEEYPNSSINE